MITAGPKPHRTPSLDTAEHGTYAMYQRERRHPGVTPCADCRRANAEYTASRRANSPAAREYDRALSAARNRAYTRLVALHPGQFRALLDDEMRREGL